MQNLTAVVQSNGQKTNQELTTEQKIKDLQDQLKAEKAKAKAKPFEPFSTPAEYKGNAMLMLSPYPGANQFSGQFSFGKNKAKLIVALFADIKKFAESK